jgi:hypothetical protein
MKTAIFALVATAALFFGASEPASAQVNVRIPGTGINVNYNPFNRGYYYDDRYYYNRNPNNYYYYNRYPNNYNNNYYRRYNRNQNRYYNRYYNQHNRGYWVDGRGRVHRTRW